MISESSLVRSSSHLFVICFQFVYLKVHEMLLFGLFNSACAGIRPNVREDIKKYGIHIKLKLYTTLTFKRIGCSALSSRIIDLFYLLNDPFMATPCDTINTMSAQIFLEKNRYQGL